MYSIRSEEQKAIDLGAVICLRYHTKARSKYYSREYVDVEFSRHYFNKDGKEIAYFINDTVDLLGLHPLETPRSWGNDFIQNPKYKVLHLN